MTVQLQSKSLSSRAYSKAYLAWHLQEAHPSETAIPEPTCAEDTSQISRSLTRISIARDVGGGDLLAAHSSAGMGKISWCWRKDFVVLEERNHGFYGIVTLARPTRRVTLDLDSCPEYSVPVAPTCAL